MSSKRRHKEAEEDLTGQPTRPPGAVQHAMIRLEGGDLIQPHDPQDRGDRALARGQDGAHHEERDMPPYAGGEHGGKTGK